MRHLASSLGLAFIVALTGVTTAVPAVADPTGTSPPGELLIVTTNLKEAFDPADVAESSDMRNYVRRLLNQVPYFPDVLLVQEVRRSSAATVAKLMSRATGSSYRVAHRPGEPPWVERSGRIIDRETAVIVDSSAVEVLGSTGTFKTRYPREDAKPGEPVRVRHHAYASVRERDGGASLTFASVHYVQNGFLKSYSLGEWHKRRWVTSTASFLEKVSSDQATQASLIGGDFNASRGTRDSQANHSHSAWLLAITDDPFNFFDAVWEVTREGGPDFLMTESAIVDAGVDMYYDTQRAHRDGYFYSDHRFRWAVIAPGEPGEPWEWSSY